nr:beta-propeller fold lactonase family protein [Ancylobacter sp. Lp-2]
MKTLTRAVALAALLAPAFAGSADADSFVYVSNAKDGNISTYRLHEDGRLDPGKSVDVAPLVMPMTVHPDHTILYAGVRSEPFRLKAYRIDPGTGGLSPLGETPLPNNMLYLSMDRTGRYLFAASNSSNLIAVFGVDATGKVSDAPLQVVSTANYPHAIRIDADNRYLYVPTLAANGVEQLTFDAAGGKVAYNTPERVSTGDEKGPRHFVISPDNRQLYVVSQFRGEVIAFSIDAATGRLTRIGEVSGLPGNTDLHPGQERPPVSGQGVLPPDPKAIWAADIHITPDGRFVYMSERTTSQLIGFRRDEKTGQLTYLGATQTEAQPRGFAIDPSGRYLVATGEKSDQLTVYAINSEDGTLAARGRYPAGKGANWVEIVAAH